MFLVRRSVLVLLALLAATEVRAAPVTVAYGAQSKAQVLDAYRPASVPAKLVVYVHGGGWSGGV